jgi:AraC-like DNA-binding protein/uncharacterized protein YutD
MPMKESLKENIKHGDLLFHMSVHKTIVPPEQSIKLYYHWHPEVEILHIIKGSSTFQIGEEEYHVNEGDIVFIKSNELHGSYDNEKSELEFNAILIDYDFISSMTNDRIQQKYIRPFYENDSRYTFVVKKDSDLQKSIISPLCSIYESYFSEAEGYEIYIKALIFEIIYMAHVHHIQKSAVNENLDNQKGLIMKKIIHYMNHHYKDKIQLLDIANDVGMSVGHFCRFFKANFNITFGEYIINLRMREAVKLLEETEKSISEIAMDTGFTDPNYFTTAFKKVFGSTPSKYRKG